MHRGSRLVHECGSKKSLGCGYHGWRFGLDGSLEHVPGDAGFGAIDVSRMRLQSIRVAEGAGLVWVCLDPDTPNLDVYLSGILDELEPYSLDEMVPIQDTVFTIPVNWKSMLENAFDYYHVHEVHRATIHAHVDDQPELALYGDHVRQNLHIAPYRWRRFVDSQCSRGGPYSEKQKSRLHKYTLFPNTMINVLPYHLTVMRFWPDGVGKTRLHYTFCQRRGARGLEWLRAHATWAASRFILFEDVRMLVRCQSRMDSETVPQHLLHDFEAASMHFHDVLSRWIES
jgi:phenylpropionate dioxygenase-like ring-hydroxylating dioxygenase large terminal subunit